MASKRISGVTVEIGGDTQKLNSALKEIDGSLKNTQTSLKDVNKLLKLDPTNTELLRQKQALLKDAVNETETRLAKLKETQEQAAKDPNYDTDSMMALNREIIATEDELKRLQEESEKAEQRLSKIGEAKEKLSQFGQKAQEVGGNLTENLTTPIVGFGKECVESLASFDASMSNVQAISGATAEEMEQLRDKAKEMGEKTKFSASESADALSYMAMAGWKTQDMLNGLPGIMDLAAASGEDLALTSDIVTDALTAFRLKAEDSAHFADVLAAASSNANTNVSLLGESFKYAAPVAGAMGYTAEDTAVALGLMANAGIKASNGGTALRSLMTRMAKPTKESKTAMDELGLSMENADGTMKSFREIMDDIRSSFAGYHLDMDQYTQEASKLEEEMNAGQITLAEYNNGLEDLSLRTMKAAGAQQAEHAAMLAGKTGMAGLLAIVGSSEEDYNKLINAVDTASESVEYQGQVYEGQAALMAGVMQDNLEGQMTILNSQLEALKNSFGEILMPLVRQFVGWIQGLVDWLNKLSKPAKIMITVIGGLVAALGPAIMILGKMATGIVSMIDLAPKIAGAFSAIPKMISGIGSAFSGLFSLIMAHPVIAIIVAIVAAIALLWTKCEWFRDGVTKIFQVICDFCVKAWETIRDGVLGAWNALSEGVTNGCQVIGEFFTGFWNGLVAVLQGIWNGIVTVVQAAMNVVVALFTTWFNLITLPFRFIWENCKDILFEVWDAIVGFLSSTWDTISAVATTTWTLITTVLTGFWNKLSEDAQAIWNAISKFFTDCWNAISKTAKEVWTPIAKFFTDCWNGISKVATDVWNAISKFFSDTWNKLSGFATTTFNAVKETVCGVWNAISETAHSVWDGLTGWLSGMWEGIKQTAGSIFEGIKSAITGPIEKAKEIIKGIVDTIKGFFDKFHINLPHIKLPHFGIQPEGWQIGDLLKGSIPSLGIEWYAKGGILNSPTIFGANGGTLLGGGEKGPEAVLPLKVMWDQMGKLLDSHQPNLSKVESMMESILSNSNKVIVLDSGAMVGQLAPKMNLAFETASKMEGRR